MPFNELAEHLIATKETVVINENAIEEAAKHGMTVTPGTEMAKSMVFVPLVAGGETKGFVSIQNVDREDAFSESGRATALDAGEQYEHRAGKCAVVR